jgi:hypothetical protein
MKVTSSISGCDPTKTDYLAGMKLGLPQVCCKILYPYIDDFLLQINLVLAHQKYTIYLQRNHFTHNKRKAEKYAFYTDKETALHIKQKQKICIL